MIEYAVKDCVFHFNKKHLEDPTIPMWCLKFAGQTLYVDHVDCKLPWSTKETVESKHTKGSIKIQKALLSIDDDNCVTITELRDGDLARLRAIKRNYARIIISDKFSEIADWFKLNNVKHSTIKTVIGSCGSRFQLCDIKQKSDIVMMALTFQGAYRILLPNELYFRAYEDPELLAQLDADEYYDGQE